LGSRAASTHNRNLDALRSAIAYWREQDWLSADPIRIPSIARPGIAPSSTRPLQAARE
jgi:hypothetical protein